MKFYDAPSPDSYSNYSDYGNNPVLFFVIIGAIILISAICIIVTIAKNKKRNHMQRLVDEINMETNNDTDSANK